MATLKAVQKGTATIAAGAASGTASISAVTLANTFLRFSYRVAPGANNNLNWGALGGSITSTTQLTFYRNGSTSSPAASIEWSVVEFTSGVTVQRGSTAQSAITTNQTISSVTTTKAWPILGFTADDSAETSDLRPWYVTYGSITTATNLAFYDSAWEEGITITNYWQVVEYDNCTAALYTNTKSAFGASTQTITSVTTTKTLLFASCQHTEDPVTNEWVARIYLTNATTVTFTNAVLTGDIVTKLYTVNITDSVAVQRADTAVASGDTVTTPTITSVTTANSIVHITSSWDIPITGSAFTTDGRIQYMCYSASVSSATQVTLTRATSGYTSNATWEVIDWTGILAATARTWVIWIPMV